MKIVLVIGARPQFIKASPLSKELGKEFDEFIIHTGQHYDYGMNDIFFNELDIPKPDINLGVGSGLQGWQTGRMLEKIEKVLIEEKPGIVLVYGDTNSTIAGALAASKLHIPVCHVEAGLRSYDRTMPEEINRVLTDHASNYLFCPTDTAVSNLQKEGITRGVHLTGDVMIDALNQHLPIAEKKSRILEELDLESKSYCLATIHRQANTDIAENLKDIVKAFCQIDNLVLPCHPRTKKALKQYGLYEKLKSRITLIDPVGYVDMLLLEKNAKKILTDSGGIQKEAYILKVPCITIRDNTEWIETVEDGWNVLTGTDTEKIVKMTNCFEPRGKQRSVFGKGDASKKIVRVVKGHGDV
ncbi:MAG: non-hydrolyzing UDP-N-acetylglucosamine 2-epimerase [Candidatus Methanofastidiosia archaeon]